MPTVDPALNRSMLDALFAGLEREHEWIELRVITKERQGQQFFFKSVGELLVKVAETGQAAHCYVGIAYRKGRGGTKEDVARVPALWADLDAKDFGGRKALALEAAYHLALAPSFVVDTGYGYHAYWLLEAPCSLEEAEDCLQRIRTVVGGDAVCDASRIMRVPGSWNVKQDTPVQSFVMRGRPELKYKYADLHAITKLSDDSRKRILSGSTDGKKSRSERDWGVTIELLRLGISRDCIKLLFQEQPIGDKYKEAGDAYFERTLENAADRVGAATEGLPAGSFFFEQGDTWWIISAQGKHQVSTFVFEPRRLLESPGGDVLYGDIRADGHRWSNVTLPRSAFSRMDTLMRHLPMASWQWLGTDREIRYLLPYVVQKWKELGRPKARGVNMIGRYDNLWVWEGGALSADAQFDNYTSPIVFVPVARTRPKTKYLTAAPDDAFRALLVQVGDLLPKINRPEVIWPIIGWFMATPLKTVLEEMQIRFPLLDLYGTRGSGKSSTVLQVMMPLLGHVEPHAYDCSTTAFVLLSLLASTNSVPVSLGEFRQSSLTRHTYETLTRYMLLAYDTGYDARGRADQTTVDYALAAPFCVDGEDSVTDSAILERAVVINLSPDDIREETPSWFSFLELIDLPLSQLAAPYIQYTLKYDKATLQEVWDEAQRKVRAAFPRAIATRIRRNISVVYMGAMLFTEFMRSQGVTVALPPASILEEALNAVSRESLGRTNTLVDDLVGDIVNYVSLALRDPLPFAMDYDAEQNVLWFHLTTTQSWWAQKRRSEGRDLLNLAAIKVQLKERSQDSYVGPGQYIRGPTSRLVRGESKWMYGIDVTAAHQSGLDVPDRISIKQVTLTFKGGVTEATPLDR